MPILHGIGKETPSTTDCQFLSQSEIDSLLEDVQSIKPSKFWDSFWETFRHPIMIYMFGFTAGFIIRGWF